MRPVGPPITGHTLMHTNDPTVGERIAGTWLPTIRIIVRTMRNDELTITACAAQTPDEPPKTLGNTSGGTMREHVGQDSTVKTFHRVSQAARAMTSHKAGTAWAMINDETAIRRIRILRCQPHAMRPGTKTMHPWALIAVEEGLQCSMS